jgi:excinuclease ABC subunit C
VTDDASSGENSEKIQADPGPPDLREAIRRLPTTSGVYLMKDALGRVIYVGKAVNLRSRVGSYFNSAAAEDIRTANLIPEIRGVDFIETESEVDALLLEARLIKDVQPRFNHELKDDKTFPYLEIRIREDFPRVEFTRKPRPRGTKLYGPFTNAKKLRAAIGVLQKIFRFRTCSLDIAEGDERWRWFRPCLLHSINQCTAPCNLRISREDYRRGIRRLLLFLDGKKVRLLREMRREMEQASTELKFEKAARIRDEIKCLENLDLCGKLDEHVQPEVFYIDPKRGWRGSRKSSTCRSFPDGLKGLTSPIFKGARLSPASCSSSTAFPSSTNTSAIRSARSREWTILPPFEKSSAADFSASPRRRNRFLIFC